MLRNLIFLTILFGILGQASEPADRSHSSSGRGSSAQPGTGAGTESSAQQVAGNFEVQKIADGVYAVIRKDLPGLMVDANNVFIVDDEGVVVVDSNGAPSITRQVLLSLSKLTDKPVRYVINTHWHDDHIRGNSVYRAAVPGVQFIGHSTMRGYLSGQGAVNRRNFLQQAPRFLDHLRGLLKTGKSLGGGELTDEERASYASDIRLADLVLREGAESQTVLPDIAVEDGLTLWRGRAIEIRHMGSGHTASDLVVHLPEERILITGDLVVWPVPLVGDPQSHVADWATTLEKLQALKPATIVPGHGPVMRSDEHLRLLHDLFTSVSRQARAAVARGETLEQARKSLSLENFQRRFAGESAVRKAAFDMYVSGPAVAVAFREAGGQRQPANQ